MATDNSLQPVWARIDDLSETVATVRLEHSETKGRVAQIETHVNDSKEFQKSVTSKLDLLLEALYTDNGRRMSRRELAGWVVAFLGLCGTICGILGALHLI